MSIFDSRGRRGCVGDSCASAVASGGGSETRAEQGRPKRKKASCRPTSAALPLKLADWRLLLVHLLLLLDVAVLGLTALQHIWQPSALVEKLLQTHAASLDAAAMNRQLLQEQLEMRLPWALPSQRPGFDFPDRLPREVLSMPLAVKRELGLSCCCGWLALATMGLLSLALSLGGSGGSSANSQRPRGASSSEGETTGEEAGVSPSSSGGLHAQVSPSGQRETQTRNATSARELRSSRGGDCCRRCGRVRQALVLEAKLKALLIATCSFLVFFAFNLSIQLHGRYAQAKVVASTLGSLAAAAAGRGSAEGAATQQEKGDLLLPSAASSASAAGTETSGSSEALPPQSPLYSPWEDAFFWGEVLRDFVSDPEIQVSLLWLALHAAALVLGMRLEAFGENARRRRRKRSPLLRQLRPSFFFRSKNATPSQTPG